MRPMSSINADSEHAGYMRAAGASSARRDPQTFRPRSRPVPRAPRAIPSPWFLLSLAVPPPPWTAPPPPPPGTPTPSAALSQRVVTPAEYGVLVQDFRRQKGKMIVLPVLGLFASALLIGLDDWTMSPLILFSLLSPLVVVALRKYRDAIAAGSVLEYRGVPTATSQEMRNSKPFYQVRFGTETLSMPPTLYGRFLPNQANTLAVFERAKGQMVALSVNGYPLPAPLRETVVPLGPPTAAGASGTPWAAPGGKS